MDFQVSLLLRIRHCLIGAASRVRTVYMICIHTYCTYNRYVYTSTYLDYVYQVYIYSMYVRIYEYAQVLLVSSFHRRIDMFSGQYFLTRFFFPCDDDPTSSYDDTVAAFLMKEGGATTMILL